MIKLPPCRLGARYLAPRPGTPSSCPTRALRWLRAGFPAEGMEEGGRMPAAGGAQGRTSRAGTRGRLRTRRSDRRGPRPALGARGSGLGAPSPAGPLRAARGRIGTGGRGFHGRGRGYIKVGGASRELGVVSRRPRPPPHLPAQSGAGHVRRGGAPSRPLPFPAGHVAGPRRCLGSAAAAAPLRSRGSAVSWGGLRGGGRGWAGSRGVQGGPVLTEGAPGGYRGSVRAARLRPPGNRWGGGSAVPGADGMGGGGCR